MMIMLFKGALTLIVTGLVSIFIVETLTNKNPVSAALDIKEDAAIKIDKHGNQVVIGQFIVSGIMAIVWVMMFIWNFGDIMKTVFGLS